MLLQMTDQVDASRDLDLLANRRGILEILPRKFPIRFDHSHRLLWFSRASSSVAPCVFAPGISATKPTHHSPSRSRRGEAHE